MSVWFGMTQSDEEGHDCSACSVSGDAHHAFADVRTRSAIR
jgi:hypothetical protein